VAYVAASLLVVCLKAGLYGCIFVFDIFFVVFSCVCGDTVKDLLCCEEGKPVDK